MKKALIFAGAALLTGAMAVAASVTGNNTVAIIEKEAVISNSYQFLCVPLKAIDITGTKAPDAPVTTLAKLFPPANAEPNMMVTIGADTYVVQKPEGEAPRWETTAGAKAIADDIPLKPGTVMWVQQMTKKPLFVGQTSDVAELPAANAEGGIVEAGNVNDKPLSIVDTFTEANYTLTPGVSLLYRLSHNAANYRIYHYEAVAEGKNGWTVAVPGKWRREAINAAEVIQPGEAFYIQDVKPVAP